MATLTASTEPTLPEPGTIYPDNIDESYFNYLREHIGALENSNSSQVHERISYGALKNLYVVDGLYAEGVPVEYIDIVSDGITELADDTGTLNCIFWLIQQSAARVYLQPRNRISSGNKHIGNIWIFGEDGYLHLFMVKQN
jgi:hypothetical protein